ncbi:putative ATP-dependent RNA helicase DDX56 [Microtus ochrogaster]|uniref:RNA helicase n=1 Tax=Microtus ochrogaster TaxID=79684 RepID=A0A8J6GW64_MICOH|nr:putative ATP-dependent RNA helicase DDX56 [Microtus ochrogaster]
MEDQEALGFEHMGLDPRLLQAVTDLGWSRPTLIQEKAIPLALEGKDLLARARTGSGKTAAYAIPMLQLLLHKKAVGSERGQWARGSLQKAREGGAHLCKGFSCLAGPFVV